MVGCPLLIDRAHPFHRWGWSLTWRHTNDGVPPIGFALPQWTRVLVSVLFSQWSALTSLLEKRRIRGLGLQTQSKVGFIRLHDWSVTDHLLVPLSKLPN